MQIIDCKKLAKEIQENVKEEIDKKLYLFEIIVGDILHLQSAAQSL